MYFVFVTKSRLKSASRGNIKIIVTRKEIPKLFPCVYFTTHYNMVLGNVEKTLRERFPNTAFFLVRIFLYSD